MDLNWTSAVVIVAWLATVASGALVNHSRPAGMCGYPGNNANSLTNFTSGTVNNWVNSGTVVTYACDAGYRMFSGNEHRTCRHDGTWSSEAPICAQQISFGKNITCTSASCRKPTTPDADQNFVPLVHVVDDNDDTCSNVKSQRVADVTSFQLDLLDMYQVRVFRFVFRGNAAQFVNPHILLGSEHQSVYELKPSECIITKDTLQSKGDGYAMIIRPNSPRWARYINIYVNHRDPNEEIGFCEIQAYADDAPSFHQCFTPMVNPSGARGHDLIPSTGVLNPSLGTTNTNDKRSDSGTMRNTVVHRGQCYTFESHLMLEWVAHREQCGALYQGELIHDVTEDINRALTSFVQVKGSINNYWMGGYTERRPTMAAVPEYVPMWISGNPINNPLLESKPDHCLAFAAPKGLWMIFPCYYRTGSICQSRIKRCGSLPLSEHMTATQPWRTEVGVTNVHRCPSGYGLVGSESRVCQANGRWSGAPPTCIYGGANKDKFTMADFEGLLDSAGIGIVIGVIVGIILILIALFFILKKQGAFRHKMNIGNNKHSESIEVLECDNQKPAKKERSSMHVAGSSGQNYDSLVEEQNQTIK